LPISAHTAWRHIAGKQETVRPSVMTDADMSETIDNALVEKDMVGCYQILDQLWGWRRTRLGCVGDRDGDSLMRIVRRTHERNPWQVCENRSASFYPADQPSMTLMVFASV